MSISDLDDRLAGLPWASERPILLSQLEDLGLAVRLPGDPPSWQTVAPDIALAALALDGERALFAARQRCRQLSAAFRSATPGTDPVRLVDVLHGRRAIDERMRTMQHEARKEVRCFDAAPDVSPAPQHNTVERDLLRRGIRYRILYDWQGLDLPGRLSDVQDALGLGVEGRVTDVPLKLMLSDSSSAMLPLQHDPNEIETSLVVYESGLLEALSALFELYWNRAIPLPVRNGRLQLAVASVDRPTSVDRDLLPLLAAGFTDLAVANQLGCNERTVRRHLKDMMRRLDAATRFQAGYQAIRRGWLTRQDVD